MFLKIFIQNRGEYFLVLVNLTWDFLILYLCIIQINDGAIDRCHGSKVSTRIMLIVNPIFVRDLTQAHSSCRIDQFYN